MIDGVFITFYKRNNFKLDMLWVHSFGFFWKRFEESMTVLFSPTATQY